MKLSDSGPQCDSWVHNQLNQNKKSAAWVRKCKKGKWRRSSQAVCCCYSQSWMDDVPVPVKRGIAAKKVQLLTHWQKMLSFISGLYLHTKTLNFFYFFCFYCQKVLLPIKLFNHNDRIITIIMLLIVQVCFLSLV